MFLLLMREWCGYGRDYKDQAARQATKPEIGQVAFVTQLRLGEALRRIKAYSDAYKERYGQFAKVYEFQLLAVSTIEHLTEEEIELTGASHVEKLPQCAEDFSRT